MKKLIRLTLNTLLLTSLATASVPELSEADAQRIGKLIWQNE
ncbi:MAG: hypothetical protein AAF571_13510 [Verrucomicrobiota bacterium]